MLQGRGYMNDGVRHPSMITQSNIVECAAGGTVYVRSSSGDGNCETYGDSNQRESTFGGFLISLIY